MRTRRHEPSPLPGWARRGRSGWAHVGGERPAFAEEPTKGRESVWDYPRPPLLVGDERLVVVRSGQHEIARSVRSIRMLETASPPTFYLPEADIDMSRLVRVEGVSRCEWKGEAHYYDVVSSPAQRIERAAWGYVSPFAPYEALTGYVSFYPAVLECTVDDERVRPQPGGFYGGWVTSDVCGPFKGEPGTGHW